MPFVFLTTLQDVGFSTDHLEQLIDDVIYLPIQKIELQAKLRVLLRSRSYSLELKIAQDKLQESLSDEKELNQLKSRFVSMVSHEFRNPRNGISGMTQILQAYGDKLSTEKKAEILAGLQRNVTKMTELIDGVLIISRKDMGKMQLNPTLLNLETFCRGLISELETIIDRGIGIPAEDIPHLFDSFYRASNSEGYQGTGLGLAIVKEYVIPQTDAKKQVY